MADENKMSTPVDNRNNMPLMLYGLDTAFDAVLDIIKCVGEGNNVTD